MLEMTLSENLLENFSFLVYRIQRLTQFLRSHFSINSPDAIWSMPVAPPAAEPLSASQPIDATMNKVFLSQSTGSRRRRESFSIFPSGAFNSFCPFHLHKPIWVGKLNNYIDWGFSFSSSLLRRFVVYFKPLKINFYNFLPRYRSQYPKPGLE